MAVGRTNRGSRDRGRINLGEVYEVSYWTKALGVSEEKLRATVARVGSSAEKVRAELNRDRCPATSEIDPLAT